MMRITYDPKNPVHYEEKFKPGDKVRSLQTTTFTDGGKHLKDQIIEVTEQTKAYFNVCHEYYEKVS